MFYVYFENDPKAGPLGDFFNLVLDLEKPNVLKFKVKSNPRLSWASPSSAPACSIYIQVCWSNQSFKSISKFEGVWLNTCKEGEICRNILDYLFPCSESMCDVPLSQYIFFLCGVLPPLPHLSMFFFPFAISVLDPLCIWDSGKFCMTYHSGSTCIQVWHS